LNLYNTHNYKKNALFGILLFLFIFQLSAKEVSSKVNTTDPFIMVEQIANQVFSRLQNESIQIRKNPNLLKNVIREEVSPYFNHRYAAAKVLGNVHFRKATKKQFNDFSGTFGEYVITSYAQIFTLYTNQTIKFQPSKTFKNKKIISVVMEIISTSRPPVDISFKLRMNKKTKEWRIFDLVAEGISFLDSKRSELNKLLNEKGIESTNEFLIKKSLSDVRFSTGKI